MCLPCRHFRSDEEGVMGPSGHGGLGAEHSRGRGRETRRSGEHVRTWGQNLTHTAGRWGRLLSGAPAVGPGGGSGCGGGARRGGPGRKQSGVVGQVKARARSRGPCGSPLQRERPAWVGVGQPGTGCPSRDRWLGSRLGSWPPPRGGGSGAGGVGSAPGPWPRALSPSSRLVGAGPDTCR